MKIIWSTNEHFWSRVSRYLSKTNESHIAVVFDDYLFSLSFDCTTTGFRVQFLKRFLSINTILQSIEIPMCEKEEHIIMSILLQKCVGAQYDFHAYYWMIWRGLLFKFLYREKPQFNPWQEKDKYLCTEVIECIRDSLSMHGYNLYLYDLASMTPKEIFDVMDRQHDKIK